MQLTPSKSQVRVQQLSSVLDVVEEESGSSATRPLFETTDHARKRMAKREVPEEAIAWVLENYDERKPAKSRPGAPPADILLGDYGDGRVRIYVERGTNPPRIKSTAWED